MAQEESADVDLTYEDARRSVGGILAETSAEPDLSREKAQSAVDRVAAFGPGAVALLREFLGLSEEEQARRYPQGPAGGSAGAVIGYLVARPALRRILEVNPPLRRDVLRETLSDGTFSAVAVEAIDAAGPEDEAFLLETWSRLGTSLDAQLLTALSGKHIPATVPLLIERLADAASGGDVAADLLWRLTRRADGFERVEYPEEMSTIGPEFERPDTARTDPSGLVASWRAWWESVKDRIRWDHSAHRFEW